MADRTMAGARWALVVVACVSLAACGGEFTPAGGPLGNPGGLGVTCFPSNGESEQFTAMDQLTNNSSRPIRLLSASLLHTRNVTLDQSFAWPADRFVAIFPLSTVKNGRAPLEGFDEYWRAAKPLEGYVMQPGESVALGLAYTVGDTSQPAAWLTTRVIYEADGRRFRYDSPVAEMILLGGCLGEDDPHGKVIELLGL